MIMKPVPTTGFDWSGCHERLLPSNVTIGNSTFSRDACANAFDGNVSTYYPAGILQRNTNLFGQLRGVEEGPDTNSDYVGVNLQGAKAILTRVVFTPRPNVTDWSPPPHAYNPPVAWINWTEAMVGGMIQGSNDSSTWETLYNITSTPASHPFNTTIVFANMTSSACRAFNYFRYFNPRNTSRRYYVNTEYGPMEKIEIISLASVSEIAFYGAPASNGEDLSCLTQYSNLAVVATPHTGVYLNNVSVSIFSPLLTCRASAHFTLNGVDPTTSSSEYTVHTHTHTHTHICTRLYTCEIRLILP
jgi:hypothetical protein